MYVRRFGLWHWARDPQTARALDEIDAATFEVLGDGYARDKRQVYFHAAAIDGADPRTFVPLGLFVGKDAARVYLQDSEFPFNRDVDLPSLTYLLDSPRSSRTSRRRRRSNRKMTTSRSELPKWSHRRV